MDSQRRPNGDKLGPCWHRVQRVFKAAVLSGASGIVVAHNHVDGHAAPSASDLESTRRLHVAKAILGVSLLDDVVVGSPGRWRALLPHVLKEDRSWPGERKR